MSKSTINHHKSAINHHFHRKKNPQIFRHGDGLEARVRRAKGQRPGVPRDASEAGARGPGRQAGLVDQRKRKIPSGYHIIMGFNSDFMGLNSDFMGFNGSLW